MKVREVFFLSKCKDYEKTKLYFLLKPNSNWPNTLTKTNFCFSSTGGSQNPMQMTIDPAQKSSQPSSAPEIPYQFADPCPVKI